MNEWSIECRRLSKCYGHTTALRELTFGLPRGKVIGLLGPNGSGKTTLMKILGGVLRQSSGEVLIDGEAPGIATKRIVSYLPERSYFSNWMRVCDCIDYFSDFYEDFDRARARSLLEMLSVPCNAKLKTLSKGTKEKVQIVLVMARRARLYLLDEPLAGVDPAARNQILDLIIKNGNPEATVLLSTHLICDIEQILNEFLFLSQGAIVRYDTVQNVRQNEEKSLNALFLEVFGC